MRQAKCQTSDSSRKPARPPLVLPGASFAAATEAFRAVLRRDLAARRQVHHGVPGAEIFEGHLKKGAHLAAGHGKKLA